MVEEASAPPPELALMQEMLEAPDEAAVKQMFDSHPEANTQEFLDLLTQLVSSQVPEDPEFNKRLQLIYTQAVRRVMQANLKA